MSLNTHARCDHCEAITWVDDEDQLIEEGWLVVSYGLTDERADFCTLSCLAKWAASDTAQELVTTALDTTDEDEDDC